MATTVRVYEAGFLKHGPPLRAEFFAVIGGERPIPGSPETDPYPEAGKHVIELPRNPCLVRTKALEEGHGEDTRTMSAWGTYEVWL